MSDITVLDCLTTLDVPVDRVLEGAIEQDLRSVMVIGWDKDGKFYVASSDTRKADLNWLLDLAKQRLLE